MEAVFQERFERWKDSVRNSLLKILWIKPINTDNNGWDLRQVVFGGMQFDRGQ